MLQEFQFHYPVDVLRVKSYVDSFLDPTCVPVRISINKLDLVPDRIVASLMGVFINGGGLNTGESYIPIVLFDLPQHRSPCYPGRHQSALTFWRGMCQRAGLHWRDLYHTKGPRPLLGY